MKRLILALLFISALSRPLLAQNASGNITAAATNCDTTPAGCVVFSAFPTDSGSVGIQLSGTFTGTLQFEGTVNGSDWASLSCPTSAAGTAVSSATATGVWQCNISGMLSVRVRASAWTSGRAAIAIQSSHGSLSIGTAGGGGGGDATAANQVLQLAQETIAAGTVTSGRSAVNPIVGQAGIAAGTGVDGVTVPRFSLATNVGLPAGSNVIGHVIADTGSTTAVTGSVATTHASGAVASGAFASGSLNSAVKDPCNAFSTASTINYPVSLASSSPLVVVAASASNKFYICSIFLFSATAQNVAIVEDATAACASVDAGVIGGTTTGAGINLVANQGFTYGNGGAAVAKTASTNVNFCLISSSTGQISGNVMGVLAP